MEDTNANQSAHETPDEAGRSSVRRGGGGSEPPDVHPALMGLIQNLPVVGSKFGPKRRAALIEAFKSTINFIYPEDEAPAIRSADGEIR